MADAAAQPAQAASDAAAVREAERAGGEGCTSQRGIAAAGVSLLPKSKRSATRERQGLVQRRRHGHSSVIVVGRPASSHLPPRWVALFPPSAPPSPG